MSSVPGVRLEEALTPSIFLETLKGVIVLRLKDRLLRTSTVGTEIVLPVDLIPSTEDSYALAASSRYSYPVREATASSV